MSADIRDLEEALGYTFKNKSLLMEALTHPSFDDPDDASYRKDYERLENLGDHVIGLYVSYRLHLAYPKTPPGELVRIFESSIANVRFARVASRLNLAKYIRVGGWALGRGAQHQNSVLADVFEAIAAAVFLDCGCDHKVWHQVLERHLFRDLSDFVAPAKENPQLLRLNQLAEKYFGSKPEYRVANHPAARHDKYVVTVYLAGVYLGAGGSSSEAQAVANASRNILRTTKELRGNLPAGLPKRRT